MQVALIKEVGLLDGLVLGRKRILLQLMEWHRKQLIRLVQRPIQGAVQPLILVPQHLALDARAQFILQYFKEPVQISDLGFSEVRFVGFFTILRPVYLIEAPKQGIL